MEIPIFIIWFRLKRNEREGMGGGEETWFGKFSNWIANHPNSFHQSCLYLYVGLCVCVCVCVCVCASKFAWLYNIIYTYMCVLVMTLKFGQIVPQSTFQIRKTSTFPINRAHWSFADSSSQFNCTTWWLFGHTSGKLMTLCVIDIVNRTFLGCWRHVNSFKSFPYYAWYNW